MIKFTQKQTKSATQKHKTDSRKELKQIRNIQRKAKHTEVSAGRVVTVRATIEAGREASAPRVLDVFFFFSVLIDSKWRGEREREREREAYGTMGYLSSSRQQGERRRKMRTTGHTEEQPEKTPTHGREMKTAGS